MMRKVEEMRNAYVLPLTMLATLWAAPTLAQTLPFDNPGPQWLGAQVAGPQGPGRLYDARGANQGLKSFDGRVYDAQGAFQNGPGRGGRLYDDRGAFAGPAGRMGDGRSGPRGPGAGLGGR